MAKAKKRAKKRRNKRNTPPKGRVVATQTKTTKTKTTVRARENKGKRKRAKKRKAPKARARPRPTPKRKNTPSGDAQLRSAIGLALRRAPKTIGATASANAAYFRAPKADRAKVIRRLARGTSRQRRQAAAIAKLEARHEGPPKRPNPGLSDDEARRQYEKKHWGERGRGSVKTRGAADPRYGTAVELGKLVAVTYRTKKRGDGLSDYEHVFEGELPDLAFNDGGLIVAGGSYVIRDGGIDG